MRPRRVAAAKAVLPLMTELALSASTIPNAASPLCWRLACLPLRFVACFFWNTDNVFNRVTECSRHDGAIQNQNIPRAFSVVENTIATSDRGHENNCEWSFPTKTPDSVIDFRARYVLNVAKANKRNVLCVQAKYARHR
jgi:hypothetical protein